jgi:hypothetical protein
MIYGVPGKGESGSLGLSLGNTLEMKVKSTKDSTGFKKISILESLNFSTSYNFLADSMQWSKISMSGRTKILGTSISFSATFDPYALDTLMGNDKVRVIRVNQFEWNKNRRIARLENANLSFGFNFGSETFKKKDEKNTNQQEESNQEPAAPAAAATVAETTDGYVKFDMPWSISVNYSMRIIPYLEKFNATKMDYPYKLTADVSLSGNVTITPKWTVGMSSGYDLERKEISHTNLRIGRNLHCWGMSFNMVPTGRYKSFFFSIAVNSSILKDLKYDKRGNPRDNPNWIL